MKQRILYSVILSLLLSLSVGSCKQESLQDKAEHDAWEFTRRYCPTPYINNMRTDSICFDRKTNTYTYHCTFNGILDNKEVTDKFQVELRKMFVDNITESTTMKFYLENGFRFQYICRSEKDKKVVLFQAKL